MSQFVERLIQGPPLVADGGMGALLAAELPRLRCPEEANIVAPELVLEAHLAFIRAGAELITANTFGANRYKLAGLFLDDQLEAIVEGGVKLAREAREVSGERVLVGGSIGPIGDTHGPLSAKERKVVIAEQVVLLEGRGVDVFLLETFFDLDELELALDAVEANSSLPRVGLLTFDQGAETLAGVTAGEALDRIAGRVELVGANCGTGPQAALEALSEMALPAERIAVSLAAKPNVGMPARHAGRLVYPNASPEYFAEFAARAVTLGARLVGGCCGTMPAQIAAIRAAIDERREPRVPLTAIPREKLPGRVPAGMKTGLQQRLEAGQWVVSVELDPPKGSNLDGLVEAAMILRDSGAVHVVDVNDNPMGRARMSSLVTAAALERRTEIETIPHLTPRDSTVMGLESQLLGAHAEGIRNILAVTGDPPHLGDYPGSHGVYEIDSVGLTRMLTQLNMGEDNTRKAIDSPTSFYIGVAVNPAAENLPDEIDRLHQKIQAGARFAMTQALFDLVFLDRFLDALGGASPIPLLVGIWPLPSFQLAFRLHNEVPGIIVPDCIQRQLADAGPDARKVGLEIARTLYLKARDDAAGVYVIPPFKEPQAALELLTP